MTAGTRHLCTTTCRSFKAWNTYLLCPRRKHPGPPVPRVSLCRMEGQTPGNVRCPVHALGSSHTQPKHDSCSHSSTQQGAKSQRNAQSANKVTDLYCFLAAPPFSLHLIPSLNLPFGTQRRSQKFNRKVPEPRRPHGVLFPFNNGCMRDTKKKNRVFKSLGNVKVLK